ncbi:MAG: hypothetical protein US80_C0004G0041 [Candidatus Daviesbacteria bacterium GW2011_GWA2_38_17]|uniref:Type 4 fimbrial biogenesis protein PilX N-terminal domain-containing protein n=1 Tax=Candidatus Daviesbacteria bacterium GW2011_GWF2_38_6 TaxID=1618432 RepID=A0A0G0KCD5_9BACT|nr:MAG: hypothetical protein US80_C0004G0041 [Candidatus Daviesbacteria bacterium GW2011_GWA2_38_17]KKQ76517.1 MAG: hypothetical protein US99_C0070G0019 [Candidatus Daviesbacteria bacterium GW2011_GWF2_38_6]
MSYNNYMKNQQGLPRRQAGQVILILILVMAVALAIGISVIQRSLSDISTSSKVEQSSRAFSAAEAGIEKALRNDTSNTVFTDSRATVSNSGSLPLAGQALEYPLLGKEEVAQVWLADPNANLPNCTGYTCYTQTSLGVYWGNSSTDKAALELTIVYYAGGSYQSKKWYLDQIARTPANNFDTSADCGGFLIGVNAYRCKKTLSFTAQEAAGLMLLRARLLYNSTSQPIAVAPVSGSLPPQAMIIESTGTAGDTQRKIRVFKLDKVVPPYFDYGIFSLGEINKN